MTCAFSPRSENFVLFWCLCVLSWLKITLTIPPMKEIDPKVVEIGDLAKVCYAKENQPAGFGMLHASRGSNPAEHDTRFIYFSPVASEVCREAIGDRYTLEPCDVPVFFLFCL